jgi:thiamine biosynthesis lipoprotein
MLRRSFRAMGTDVELFLDADRDVDERLDEAEAEFHRLEALLSRFRPESELSRLNSERTLRVGPELLELVQLSLAAREQTGGRFDPTVHDAVVAAGYGQSLELVVDDLVAPLDHRPFHPGRVVVDPATSRVALGPGCRLDLGGVAKGWAADRALTVLSPAGRALVNAGGDVACGGGGPWQVGVETPRRTITLELGSGGLATSGRDRRRWQRNGREAHHLIDPSTGNPSDGDLLTVTAVGDSAAEAEVRATSLFLAGDSRRAAMEADESGVPAVLVTLDGETWLAGGIA